MPVLENFLHERFAQALHKRLWAGEKQSKARLSAYRETMYTGENPDDEALKPNTRRLCARPEVKARLVELAGHSATLAAIDSGWALLKLKRLTDDIEGFNLDDFLSPPSHDGSRFFDLSKVPPEKLRLLTEIGIEDESVTISGEEGEPETLRRTRKIKLKGPAKVDLVGPVALMARIAGWEAPKKIAATTKDGADLPLEQLVAASLALVAERRAGKAPQAST
jgi:hypothetical protein